MIINGHNYFFVVDLFNESDDSLELKGVFSDPEEAIERANLLSENMKDDESIMLSPMEVIRSFSGELYVENTTTIESFDYSPDMDTDEILENMLEELELETPAKYPDKQYPRRTRIQHENGSKTHALSEYVLIDQYDQVLRVDPDNIPTNLAKRPRIEGERINNLVCPKCMSKVANCDCNEWSDYFLEIDPMISSAVLTLNNKGYFTKWCCEGHVWENGPYIEFVAYYDFGGSLPYGWEQRGNIMSASFLRNATKTECFETVKERLMSELDAWAKKLPIEEKSFED